MNNIRELFNDLPHDSRKIGLLYATLCEIEELRRAKNELNKTLIGLDRREKALEEQLKKDYETI